MFRMNSERSTGPTREATIKSTSVVIAVTTVVAVFLGVIDLGLTQVMQLLITI